MNKRINRTFGRRTPMYLPLLKGWLPEVGGVYTCEQLFAHTPLSTYRLLPFVRVYKTPNQALAQNLVSCYAVAEVLSSGIVHQLSTGDNRPVDICVEARILTIKRVVPPVDVLLDLESNMNRLGWGTYKDVSNTVMRHMGVECLPDNVTEPIHGYKGVRSNLHSVYGDMVYEVGKEYSEDGMLMMCLKGMHFSRKLSDAKYWVPNANRFFVIEASGRVYDFYDKSKSVASKLRLVRELEPSEIKAIIKAEKEQENG